VQFKIHKYFAIVASDGDSMTEYIKTLKTERIEKSEDVTVTEFSKDCFDYAEKASATIGDFGGMTIYAGGDDLLFLAPLQSNNGKTVFDLCNELSELFKERVAGNNNTPTVSFGISIRYVKFPLYEALNSAYSALKEAKESRDKKNSMYIDWQKHSGQSVKLCVAKEGFELFQKILSEIIGGETETVNSIIYTLISFSAMFQSNSAEIIKNVFINQFDNESQKPFVAYADRLAQFYIEYAENSSYIRLTEGKIKPDEQKLKGFEGVLRIGKFFTERGN
jgi:CRISPR-associated protein Cmr2